MAMPIASRGSQAALAGLAGLLALGGFVGLGVVNGDRTSQANPVQTKASIDASTTGLPATSASVAGQRLGRRTLSPTDTSPPVSITTPVETPPATDDVASPTAPVPGSSTSVCQTAHLTVIAVEGCPAETLVGAAVALTQRAAAPPE